MSIRHMLFDLDGTLLPMVQDEFVRFYMPLLAKSYIQAGVEVDPKGFIGAVWKGYEAMVKNDGTRTNREAFWSYMEDILPTSTEESEALALRFYERDFNQAIRSTSPSPLSDQIVKTAKERGLHTYLATNPVFPRCATLNRIRWAGMEADDFELITTYEDNSYCKPNVEYFRTVLDEMKLDPAECIMVGNDVEEDGCAAALGMDAVLLTPESSNPLYRRAIRVSMGTVFQIPWTFFKKNTWPEEGIRLLKELGFRTAALALREDSIGIDDQKLRSEEKLAVILGTEGDGLASSTIADCDYTVRIPMSHGVDSLNVAAASAVAFWEVRTGSAATKS